MLSQLEKDKALGQFKLQVSGLLGIFNAYGLGVYITETVNQIETLALKLHDRLSGKDVPIQNNGPRRGRGIS